jgi:hypothetical protein
MRTDFIFVSYSFGIHIRNRRQPSPDLATDLNENLYLDPHQSQKQDTDQKTQKNLNSGTLEAKNCIE